MTVSDFCILLDLEVLCVCMDSFLLLQLYLIIVCDIRIAVLLIPQIFDLCLYPVVKVLLPQIL